MKCPKCDGNVRYHGFNDCAGACENVDCDYNFHDPEKANVVCQICEIKLNKIAAPMRGMVCSSCREALEIGRLVRAMVPGDSLDLLPPNEDGANWRFYPAETKRSEQFGTPIEALKKGLKK